MSVYVDNARVPLGNMLMCRLYADSKEELEAFAKLLRLHRHAYLSGVYFPHYRVSVTQRCEAIEKGAQPVDTAWLRDRARAEQEKILAKGKGRRRAPAGAAP